MEIEKSIYEDEFEELRRQSLNERRVTRTIEEEKKGIEQIEQLLKDEQSDFKEKYIKAFQLVAGPDCKRISWQSGLQAWKLLLTVSQPNHLLFNLKEPQISSPSTVVRICRNQSHIHHKRSLAIFS